MAFQAVSHLQPDVPVSALWRIHPPTWEDNELAAVPNEEIFSQWETFRMPADDATTGGLLPQKREDDSNLFPVWSEAWLCRTFDLPGDFTTDEKVTLLMGVIDDADVIYINGTAVASSGFKNADNVPCLNDLELGGFELRDGKREEINVVSFGGGNVTLHMDGRFCPVVVGVKAVKGVVSPKTGLW